MKKCLEPLGEGSSAKIDNEGMNTVKGGYTLNTVTVVYHKINPISSQQPRCTIYSSQGGQTTTADDGDDGITGD